jgi:LysR family transcriptional regulator, glycine cleavage system transcriptional activator
MAARWLIPRLSRFHARHPNIGINVRTSLALADFERDGIDLAIRFGAGKWSGVHAIKLADEELFPVCSPNFNEGQLPTNPAELLRFPLLRDVNLPWERWFAHVGVTLKGELRGTSFTDANLVLQAAVGRQGIALARKSIVSDELLSGRLIRLFEQGLPTAYSHYIVYPERFEKRPNVAVFRDWLLEEAAGQSPISHGGA